MKGNYEPDTFTENDVINALEGAGLKVKNGSRYLLSQCPTHDDVHPSVQIYKDDWFVNCHAGCGRFHITKAFPRLRDWKSKAVPSVSRVRRKVVPVKYKQFNLMDMWEGMESIPESHVFKVIPISVLNDLGWRYDPVGERYFIPYFSRSKTSIPFGQWRNLKSEPRFNFWKDAKPTMYGTWNLVPGAKLFLVEGCSDAAVLEYCAVPWIAAPSSASGSLVESMVGWASKNAIEIVYAGDNDEAGDKLRESLDSVAAYRVKQPPKEFNDWGDFLIAKGAEAVTNYAFEELFPSFEVPKSKETKVVDDVKNVQEIFPGAIQLEITGGDSKKSCKEQSAEPPSPF